MSFSCYYDRDGFSFASSRMIFQFAIIAYKALDFPGSLQSTDYLDPTVLSIFFFKEPLKIGLVLLSKLDSDQI